ncbi:MAG: porphobilinogen synthase, partial [Nitrosopumilaceae archaeon]|nr:porphobilinogen synthase [Nitrosopumilaceae archaeon]
MSFPTRRLRRLRINEKMRSLVQETTLQPTDLICPVFVQEGIDSKIQVESMSEIEKISNLKIPAIMLFGIPEKKDEVGTSAFDEKGIVQKAIAQIKENFGDKMLVMADVCLCQYTSTGHCGIIQNNKIDNDTSNETLAKIAVSQAKAGVDVVSPSAMMDGQVASIRKALDDSGFSDVSIMSH